MDKSTRFRHVSEYEKDLPDLVRLQQGGFMASQLYNSPFVKIQRKETENNG